MDIHLISKFLVYYFSVVKYIFYRGKKDFFHLFIHEFTAQKMTFSIKDFFSKCDQARYFLRIWSYLLKKSLIENFFFFAMSAGTFISKKCQNFKLLHKFILTKNRQTKLDVRYFYENPLSLYNAKINFILY